jgi:hypothetical protein
MWQFGDGAEERQQRRDSSCSAAHVHNVRTQMRDRVLVHEEVLPSRSMCHYSSEPLTYTDNRFGRQA